MEEMKKNNVKQGWQLPYHRSPEIVGQTTNVNTCKAFQKSDECDNYIT